MLPERQTLTHEDGQVKRREKGFRTEIVGAPKQLDVWLPYLFAIAVNRQRDKLNAARK